jgi:hypothetical protein
VKNFMVANLSKNKRYKSSQIETLVKAQIDNSLELGWKVDDIILLANFDLEFRGVKTIRTDLNKKCLTGSKIFGMKYLFDNDMVGDEVIWSHDLDAWQNVWFEAPPIKDAGITCYSNSKYNGGSIFWKKEARDIVEKVISEIESNKENKEEPTINKVLKSEEYKYRVTPVNRTFNVGCSGYVKRWLDSIKPLRVCHFHPYNFIAWETHALDRNGLDVKGITNRLESLLRRYYPTLATELGSKGKKAQKERKEERLIKG